MVAASAGVAHATEVTIVGGGAAIATYDQTSDDGCEITHGEIAVVEARQGGELANGLYVTGVRENVCLGVGNGYAGFAEGRFDVVGLIFARFTGVAVVESYSGGPPLTFELDVRWLGTGGVTRDHGVFRDGSAIEFTFTASRTAATFGGFMIDGEPASLATASLVRETHGRIER